MIAKGGSTRLEFALIKRIDIKEQYMEELEKITFLTSKITFQIMEMQKQIAEAKGKCEEATEKKQK